MRRTIQGFKNKYSCQFLFTKLLDDWETSLDSNQFVGGSVYAQGFRLLTPFPYHRLIMPMILVMTRVNLCLVVQCQAPKSEIQNNRSNRKLVSKGVPHRSIIGFLLFNIFMNDMFLSIKHCHLYNYTYDNSMSASAKYGNVVSWYISNGMKANLGKFQFMSVSPHDVTNKKPELLVNDIVLKP